MILQGKLEMVWACLLQELQGLPLVGNCLWTSTHRFPSRLLGSSSGSAPSAEARTARTPRETTPGSSPSLQLKTATTSFALSHDHRCAEGSPNLRPPCRSFRPRRRFCRKHFEALPSRDLIVRMQTRLLASRPQPPAAPSELQ